MYVLPGFKEINEADTRSLDAFVAIGTNIDQTSADDITSIEGDFLPMTNTEQATDANYVMTEWMTTFEGDGIRTAVDSDNLAPPIVPTAYPPEVGLWSSVISDSNGSIDFQVVINLSKVHESALTVFTYGMNILEATVEYYVGTDLKRTASMEARSGKVTDVEGSEYDKIVIKVTKVDAPFIHVKISEIEFGSSESYNKSKLSGSVKLVREFDPTMQSIPLHELDFAIFNVMGDYDPDNPNGFFESIRMDYPCEFTITEYGEDGSRYSVPLGRYVISDRVSNETELGITAYDGRKVLQNNRGGLSLSTSKSFGDTIIELFDDIHVPYQIDDDLFSEYPDQDITFDGDMYDLLTCFLFIEQYYDIWLVPTRSGFIRATKSVPSDDYGLVNPEMMYTFPLPYSVNSFNFVQISYGDSGEVYEMDMRTDLSQAKSMISISNPLVKTAEKAQEIANRILVSLYHSQVEVEWRDDPTLDVNDHILLSGKWNAGNPVKYKVVYHEITYDGGLSSIIRSVR